MVRIRFSRCRVLAIGILLWLSPAAVARAACLGDCNDDQQVTVDELLAAIGISLGTEPYSRCQIVDRDRNLRVTVDEIVAALQIALNGCPPTATPSPSASTTATPAPTHTATATATRSGTSSPSPTPTVTPTPTGNLPPVFRCRDVYRGQSGAAIEITLAADDPEAAALTFAGDSLPPGASVVDGRLEWTPADDQVGAFYVRVSATDDDPTPATGFGQLTFAIAPPDACGVASCDPSSGCQSQLAPIATNCCHGARQLRLPEPEAGCPFGRVLFVGRNSNGIGRLESCDDLPYYNVQQLGAFIVAHVEARCVDSSRAVALHVRLETAERIAVDSTQSVRLQARPDGFAQARSVPFDIQGPSPFFDLDDAEANFEVTLDDGEHPPLRWARRVVLRRGERPDLVDPPPPPAPEAPCSAQ